jgi:DNA repair protein RadC
MRESALKEAGLPELWPASRPHHAGHRDRLRERARQGGLAALPDYELLELYLFRSIPRADVKPLAKALIARFGSLSAVWAASLEELCSVSGVGEAVALDLRLAHEAARRSAREAVARRPVISSQSALLAYVKLTLVHNHPSGDPTPSGADVDMTRKVVEAGRALGIAVHDHLVVARHGTVSLKGLGLV